MPRSKKPPSGCHVTLATEEGAQLLAVKLHLASIVTGRLSYKKKVLTLHLKVRDGGSGAIGDESTWSAATPGALAHVVEKKLWRDVGAAIRGGGEGETPRAKNAEETPEAAPPSAVDDLLAAKPSKREPQRQGIDEAFPEPPPRRVTAKERAAAEAAAEADAPAPAPALDPESERERAPAITSKRRRARDEEKTQTTNGPAALEVAVGPRLLLRQLTYGSDPDNALTPFGTRQPGPAIGGSILWLPRLGTPRVGVSLEGEYAGNMRASSDSDLTYKVSGADYSASGVIGFSTSSLTMDLVAGGGRQWFAFVPEGIARTRPRLAPDVTYDYVRAGVAVRFYTSGNFTLLGAAYYRYVINAGAIRTRDWFPSAKVWGFQGSLGVSYRILPWWEARLDADLRSYQFTMDGSAGDGRATDSARDQYVTGWLSMVLRFGGETH